MRFFMELLTRNSEDPCSPVFKNVVTCRTRLPLRTFSLNEVLVITVKHLHQLNNDLNTLILSVVHTYRLDITVPIDVHYQNLIQTITSLNRTNYIFIKVT